MSSTKKFIIITSIAGPTKAIREFAKLKDWQLLVVGDRKTPADWHYDGVVYLSPDDQEKLNFSVLKRLPWNNYARKIVGYLYAISHGAEAILESDDDNIPLPNHYTLPFEGEFKTLYGQPFVNAYNYFTDEFIWPRGYPLKWILDKRESKSKQSNEKIGIWQFLADGDPDVDAIYRLTINKLITFKKNEPVVLDENTICPINSQNTMFRPELFSLLYLPAFVNFRFTDILRGLIAQPILWQNGFRVGFGPATVVQERNEHDYLVDFESEIPVFLHAENVHSLIKTVIKPGQSVEESLLAAYKLLQKKQLVTSAEVELVSAWLQDIKQLRKA